MTTKKRLEESMRKAIVKDSIQNSPKYKFMFKLHLMYVDLLEKQLRTYEKESEVQIDTVSFFTIKMINEVKTTLDMVQEITNSELKDTILEVVKNTLDEL